MGCFPMSAEANKGSIRYLFVFYPIPIRPNVKIDRNKGTKKRVKHRTWRSGLSTNGTKKRKGWCIGDFRDLAFFVEKKYKTTKVLTYKTINV